MGDGGGTVEIGDVVAGTYEVRAELGGKLEIAGLGWLRRAGVAARLYRADRDGDALEGE